MTTYLTTEGERVEPAALLGRRCTAFDDEGNCFHGVLTQILEGWVLDRGAVYGAVTVEGVEVVMADEVVS